MLIQGPHVGPNSTPTGRRRVPRRLLLLFLVIGLTVAPVAGVAAWFQSPTDASPATGSAQVIAQGVITIPASDLIWRIERQVAPPPASAEPVVASNGFLLGAEGSVLVEDTGEGPQTRLAAGEAVLTREGTEQVRAAIGATAATYFDIALVAADATPSTDGELLFTSEPFVGLDGRHDVDLVRDVLPGSGTMELPSGAGPTLLFVTAGAVDVTLVSGEVFTLAADQAIAVSGPVVMTAGADGAVALAAVTGPAVPRLTGPDATTETPVPVATPAAGTPTAEEPDEADGAPSTEGTPEATAEAPATEETADDAADEPVADEAAEEPAAEPPVEEPAVEEPATDDGSGDSDGDGLSDAQEAELNTDPSAVDTDGDGLTDGDEVLVYGTAPLAPDSDGDGILDGDEVSQGTDPLSPASYPGAPVDSDGDGLPDSLEYELGTDPFVVDTDGDGLTDGDEYYVYQTGTLNPDTDGDGFLDGQEIENGTDPNDPNSF